MFCTRIIPCLDVKDGRTVKGTNFKNIIDAGDPVEQAIAYDKQGADELVFLDISASLEGKETIFDVVEKTAKNIFMPLTVGGGVRETDDIKRLLLCGADKVSINTTAVLNPKIVEKGAKIYGSQCITVAIDAKALDDENTKWGVFTHGGTKDTGIDLIEWCKTVAKLGAGEILLTSIDRDGTKNGYNLNMLKAVSQAVNLPIIASGGVGNLEHLADGALVGGATGLLAASIFHFGNHTIEDAKKYLSNKGLSMRI